MEHEKGPRVVVSAIIRNERKFLLTKETLEDGKEYWIFPGGGVKFGESLEEAVKREVKEELGIEIEIEKLLGFKESIHTNHNYHSVIFFFLAKPRGNFTINDEKILDARYFSLEETKNLNLVESARWVLEKLNEPRI
jgi:8-oxo-dGTP diphosphatase